MKKILSIALLSLFTFGAVLSAQTYKNELNPKNLTTIDASANWAVDVVKGNKPKVLITCDKELEEYIIVDITGSTLRLSLDHKRLPRKYNNGHYTLKADVTMPSLEKIKGSGASSFYINDAFKSQNFYCDLSGAASVKGLNVEITNSAEFDMSGASNLDLRGKISKVDFDLSGASKAEIIIDAAELSIDVSGSSSLDFEGTVTNVDVDCSGASNVKLRGSAKKAEIECSGASSVKAMNLITNDVTVDFSGASSGAITVEKSLKVELSGSSNLDYSTSNQNLAVTVYSISRASSLKKR